MMRITNRTRKTVLAEKTEIATGFWKKTLGLMFRGKLDESKGFLMEFKHPGHYGIWMLGMRFAIDLVFIGADKKVVEVCRNIRPVSLNPRTWRVYKPAKPARFVLELPAGRAEKTKTRPGDGLIFK